MIGIGRLVVLSPNYFLSYTWTWCKWRTYMGTRCSRLPRMQRSGCNDTPYGDRIGEGPGQNCAIVVLHDGCVVAEVSGLWEFGAPVVKSGRDGWF